MESRRRPSLATRTMSSPLSVAAPSVSHKAQMAYASRRGLNPLTPPSSPRQVRSSIDLSTQNDPLSPDASPNREPRSANTLSTPTPEDSATPQTNHGVMSCPFEVEILKDQRDRKQVFGYGAWSTVFKGVCHRRQTSGLLTPPLSPQRQGPLLVAVKQPARKDAHEILESEAQILNYLMAEEGSGRFIVPFFGILTSDSSLVMAAVPLSLEEHIRKSALSAKATRTTWNMTEPVIGMPSVWLDLTYKLVSGLSWLHDQAMVVHGDIKPGNILLDTHSDHDVMDIATNSQGFPHQPLLADFSSSQRLNGKITPNTLSALTPEYTAPELLSSKVLSNPESTATKASDVFSLGVTLLVAATGNIMVYSGSVFQRQAMATQGWMVIQTVQNGPLEEGARVPRQGVVVRTLSRAVLRNDMERITAADWKLQMETTLGAEPMEL